MPLPTVPYSLPDLPPDEMLRRAEAFRDHMFTRRTCRDFSDRPVARELIETCIAVANDAPSGANRQPWRFVAVSDPAIKREIRIAAEAEEHESYEHRMPPEWLEALEPLGTGPAKPFLETVPWLVAVFSVKWEIIDEKKYLSYYPIESVGLACGFFLAACHLAGLATLAHTPSPMRFLRKILRRPESERPFLLLSVGHPAPTCRVPDITKKPASAVIEWLQATNGPDEGKLPRKS